jgi:hypothetical protein
MNTGCNRTHSGAHPPSPAVVQQDPQVTANLRWAGKYWLADRSLDLWRARRFGYQGTGCFHGGDVGFPDSFMGSYGVEGEWIILYALDKPSTKGCSVDHRLFATTIAGHRVLVEEGALRHMVNTARADHPDNTVHVWHMKGEPQEYTVDPARFLPAPYAALYALAPPSGKIVAVGKTVTYEGRGAGGRLEGKTSVADVVIDIGTGRGAFDGMHVCYTGESFPILTIGKASTHTSTGKLRWSPGAQRAPKRGMRVTTRCRDNPTGA